MARQSLDTPSLLKQKISDVILFYIEKNKQYQYTQITQYIWKHNPLINIPEGRTKIISCVPLEQQEELATLVDMYITTGYEMDKVKWYLNNLFTHAEDITAVKESIPEYYWKYLYMITFNGYKDSVELFNKECFDILEQAKINNVLLGLTG